MGFWSRWFGKKDSPQKAAAAPLEPPPGPRPDPVATAHMGPIVLEEGLTLSGTQYENPASIEAVSEGLAALGQAELVMAIRLHDGDDPRALLEELGAFFRTVARLARQGLLVGDGGFSEFGPRAPFGPDVGGVLYAAEGTRLRGTIVQRAEIAVAKRAGAYRILSRLGMQARFFPYPLSADLRRPSVAQDDEPSLLSRMSTALVPGLSAVLDGNLLRLVAQPEAVPALQRLLPHMEAGSAVAWLTVPDRAASRRLFWQPGQDAPSAILAEDPVNACFCGWFFVPLPRQPASELRVIEDGFVYSMTEADWTSFLAAIRAEEPFAIPPRDGKLGLLLSWGDGTTVYHPQNPDPNRDNTSIQLLSPEDVLQRALPISTLSSYINALIAVLEVEQASLPDPHARLEVHIQLQPDDRPAVMARSASEQELPQSLGAAIYAVTPPMVTESVAFTIHLDGRPAIH